MIEENEAQHRQLVRKQAEIDKLKDRIKELEGEIGVALCRCGKNHKAVPHSCPYAEEIGDNDDPEYCTCCDDCRHDCCMDI